VGASLCLCQEFFYCNQSPETSKYFASLLAHQRITAGGVYLPLFLGHQEARKGECIKQLFASSLAHLCITVRCGAQAEAEWLQGNTKKGEVAMSDIISTTSSGGNLR
jgi:hypothetical protein